MIRGVVGVLGPVTTILLLLKLVGVINWSWLWVFAPTWIPLGLGMIIAICSSGEKK